MTLRVLCLAGSTRKASFNRRLRSAAAAMLREGGAEVTELELADHPMPIFDQDAEDEHGDPPGAKSFREALKSHDVWLIASPEYNGSITPLLKNAIDWASRQRGDDPPLVAFRGKLCALVSASPGGLGGMRALVHVRQILSGIGVLVIPGQASVASAHEALDEQGGWTDERARKRVQGVVDELLATARKLHGG